MSEDIQLEDLVGEVLTHIDESGDEIMLTTASGRKVMIYHSQDCCEKVRIESTDGQWKDLIGKVLIQADKDVDPSGDPAPEFPDSWTWTTLTFKVDDATVVSRWIGESNGYYSEAVDIKELQPSQTPPAKPDLAGEETE